MNLYIDLLALAIMIHNVVLGISQRSLWVASYIKARQITDCSSFGTRRRGTAWCRGMLTLLIEKLEL